MALKVSYFIQYSAEIYRGSIQTHLLFYQQFPLIFLIISGFYPQLYLQMIIISHLRLCFSRLNGTGF